MKHRLLSTLFASVTTAVLTAGASAAPAPSTQSDSQRKENLPHGKVPQFTWRDSKIYPGTLRRCAVYVPAQYDPTKVAAASK